MSAGAARRLGTRGLRRLRGVSGGGCGGGVGAGSIFVEAFGSATIGTVPLLGLASVEGSGAPGRPPGAALLAGDPGASGAGGDRGGVLGARESGATGEQSPYVGEPAPEPLALSPGRPSSGNGQIREILVSLGLLALVLLAVALGRRVTRRTAAAPAVPADADGHPTPSFPAAAPAAAAQPPVEVGRATHSGNGGPASSAESQPQPEAEASHPTTERGGNGNHGDDPSEVTWHDRPRVRRLKSRIGRPGS